MRATPALRAMVSETHLSVAHLICPLFVKKAGKPEAIPSMPGILRWPLDALVGHCQSLSALGLRAFALFPCVDPALKDAEGSEALHPDTLILQALRLLREALPEHTLISDIALDPYTTHGHDGLLTPCGKDVDNDATLARLVPMALLHAQAGSTFVAPSDMMDGRVGVLRAALDAAGHTRTGILAYAVKYDSAFYGPFREAVGSAQAAGTTTLSKATYQMNPANRREALLEAALDEAEGADILMVKPAGPFLDIIREVRNATTLPLAAYQVSGEYAQIHAAAQLGWLDLRRVRDESLLALRRAGADMIFTYFAEAFARDSLP